MSDEFKIQCEVCGTLYNDIEEVCPYCGTPQPVESQLEEIYIEEPEPILEPLAKPLSEDEGYDDEGGAYFEEGYAPHERPLAEDPFVDDDIFAVVGAEGEALTAEDEQFYEDEYSDEELYSGEEVYADEYAYDAAAYDPDYAEELDEELYDDEIEDEEEEEEEQPRRRWRMLMGCLGAFICIGVLYGGIGVLAAYQGIRESAAEIETEAEVHYQRGQSHLAAGSIELAIAEFERALSLNPNLLAARQALHETESLSQSQPTPTSETRSAAAALLFNQAEAFIAEENWGEALELLSKVRDLDPDYQTEQVSSQLTDIYYQQGLSLLAPETLADALQAFEQALTEQPNHTEATIQREMVELYLAGQAALETDDYETALENWQSLYEEDDEFLDIALVLPQTYERFGDKLLQDEEWCLAETQYLEAALLLPNDSVVQTKLEESAAQCAETPTSQSAAPGTPSASSTQATSTPPPDSQQTTAATPPAATEEPDGEAPARVTGTIYFSSYNPNESRWEVLSVPATGGNPTIVVTEGSMPSVSPNNQLLVYRSEAIEAVGIHVYNFSTGVSNRVTILREDILPRWGGDNSQFIFTAQELATNRWQVHLGFTDGKSEPLALRDGRTPAPAPNGQLLAYQGADPEGNNPGIYTVPLNGGEAKRLTRHESDRSPSFSPNSRQVAYMSTQEGNWDIYVVDTTGAAPRKVTTYGGNDGLPIWSPSGQHLAYVSDQGGQWAIYVIPATGGVPLKVTTWDGNARADWLLAQISWAQ